MASLIPDEWKRKVREALNSGEQSRVRVRLRASQDWDATFPDAFQYRLLAAIADALKAPGIMGGRKTMKEPTETYAFFFTFAKIRMYTKVGLMPDGTVVIVYSAHKPEKGDVL